MKRKSLYFKRHDNDRQYNQGSTFCKDRETKGPRLLAYRRNNYCHVKCYNYFAVSAVLEEQVKINWLFDIVQEVYAIKCFSFMFH